MRVVHVVPAQFGPKGVVGGAERYVYELCRAMAMRTPTTFVAFADEPSTSRDRELDVHIIGPARFPRGQRQNPIAVGLLREIAHANVVHFHQQNILASSLGAIAARLLRRRAVVTDLGGGGWDLSAYVSTDRLFQAHLHISEYSRRVFGHEGKPWAHVILGGVDVDKFSPSTSIAAESERPVLFVGRLLPHKSVHTIIDAAPTDMPVEIIGTPMHSEYFKLLTAKSAGKRVAFHTASDDTDLVKAYQRALCVVLPSVYDTIYGEHSEVPELLGQTLLEGMACGIPAICTGVASMPEIVVDGVTGFIVPANDANALREKLSWLRAHPVERVEMGRAARARILEFFRWDQVVDRCFEVYERIDRNRKKS